MHPRRDGPGVPMTPDQCSRPRPPGLLAVPCYSTRDRGSGSPVPPSVPDGRVVRPAGPWSTPQVVPGSSWVGAFRTQIHRRGWRRSRSMGRASRVRPGAKVRRARAPPGPSTKPRGDHRTPVGTSPHRVSPPSPVISVRRRIPGTAGTLRPMSEPAPRHRAPAREHRRGMRVGDPRRRASIPPSPCTTDGRQPGAYPDLEAVRAHRL